jgi:DNA-binding NarL/FixJ family response regulator
MTRDITPRQWEVLALMAEGLNQDQIAKRLGVSRHTMHTHLYGQPGFPGLYDRAGVANDVQAVVWYYQRGQYQRPAWNAPRE